MSLCLILREPRKATSTLCRLITFRLLSSFLPLFPEPPPFIQSTSPRSCVQSWPFSDGLLDKRQMETLDHLLVSGHGLDDLAVGHSTRIPCLTYKAKWVWGLGFESSPFQSRGPGSEPWMRRSRMVCGSCTWHHASFAQLLKCCVCWVVELLLISGHQSPTPTGSKTLVSSCRVSDSR